MSSVRGELLVPTVKTNGVTTSSEGGNSPPPQPKTFLRRLGIRKPSLMSLTSPLQTGRTARTFSLDDLLRPQVPSKVSRPQHFSTYPPSPRPPQKKPFSQTQPFHTLFSRCTRTYALFFHIFIYTFLLLFTTAIPQPAPHLWTCSSAVLSISYTLYNTTVKGIQKYSVYEFFLLLLLLLLLIINIFIRVPIQYTTYG